MGIVSKSRYDISKLKNTLKESLKYDPNDLNANFNMALFYEDQNDLTKAKQYYNNTIAQTTPDIAKIQLPKVYLHNEGNFELATQLYSVLLQISPNNVGIRFKLASLEQSGQNELSLSELSRLSKEVQGEEFMEQEIAEAKARVQVKL